MEFRNRTYQLTPVSNRPDCSKKYNEQKSLRNAYLDYKNKCEQFEHFFNACQSPNPSISDLDKAIRLGEECMYRRIEFSEDYCDSKIDPGHLKEIQIVDRGIEKCVNKYVETNTIIPEDSSSEEEGEIHNFREEGEIQEKKRRRV